MAGWTVILVGQSKKAEKNLSVRASSAFDLFLLELKKNGPYRSDWPNYTKMRGKIEDYHCHLQKGRPTYVVCWRIADKITKIIEVYYAGTHENAPY